MSPLNAHLSRIRFSSLIALLCAAVFSLQVTAQQLPDPTRFEEAIQKFEAQDRATPPPENAIVLTGIIVTAGFSIQSRYASISSRRRPRRSIFSPIRKPPTSDGFTIPTPEHAFKGIGKIKQQVVRIFPRDDLDPDGQAVVVGQSMDFRSKTAPASSKTSIRVAFFKVAAA